MIKSVHFFWFGGPCRILGPMQLRGYFWLCLELAPGGALGTIQCEGIKPRAPYMQSMHPAAELISNPKLVLYFGF